MLELTDWLDLTNFEFDYSLVSRNIDIKHFTINRLSEAFPLKTKLEKDILPTEKIKNDIQMKLKFIDLKTSNKLMI